MLLLRFSSHLFFPEFRISLYVAIFVCVCERERGRERLILHTLPYNLIINIFPSAGMERLLIKSADGTMLGKLTRRKVS